MTYQKQAPSVKTKIRTLANPYKVAMRVVPVLSSMETSMILGSQGTDRLDRVPRGKEVRARVIESLYIYAEPVARVW